LLCLLIPSTASAVGLFSSGLLTGCADAQVMEWEDATSTWICANPPGLGGGEANAGANLGTPEELVYVGMSGDNLTFNTMDEDHFTVAASIISVDASLLSAISGNTVHSTGDGSDHANVADNTTHSINTNTDVHVSDDHIDALTEIAQGLKTASNDTSALVVGAKGDTDHCAKWDSAGNLVSHGEPCGSGSGGLWEDGTSYVHLTTPKDLAQANATPTWTILNNGSATFDGAVTALSFTADPSDTALMLLTTVTGSNTVSVGAVQSSGDSQMDLNVDDSSGSLTTYMLLDGVGETVDILMPLDITGATDVTGALTATSYGGITEANLLDKSAAETVAGAWTFTGAPITLPGAADPTTDADYEVAFDIDGWGTGFDALELWNGTASAYAVATTATDSPTNGQVPKWNTGGSITWEDDSTGEGSLGDELASTTNDITTTNSGDLLELKGADESLIIDFD
ncbi:unnamed protein product, partial [marine sediment metagenome]